MKSWIVASLVLVACNKDKTPPAAPPPAAGSSSGSATGSAGAGSGSAGATAPSTRTLAAFEAANGQPYNGLYVSPTETLLRRTPLAPGPIAADDRPQAVLFDLDAQPGTVVLDTLRRVVGHPLDIAIREHVPAAAKAFRVLCTGATLRDTKAPPPAGEDRVELSVLVTATETWVGVSRINEFQQLPTKAGALDDAKLEAALRDHKQSTFFYERTDLELAAEPTVRADMVLSALGAICRAGFTQVTVLARDNLSAAPGL